MKNYIAIYTVLMLLTSCGTTKGVKLEAKKTNYFLDLPDGYDLQKKQGEVYKEYHFAYPDGSIFYFTDDDESGGAVNKEKIKKYGNDILVKIAVNDTIDISGSSQDEKYWREKKETGIVVGYVNATKGRKESFDNAISTMERKPKN
ncbi:hypothetical protein [Spongiimicrobium sp. 3-5]|uniref:hypothetical protein n=1 Tax=Spongiimicrobium sp. 3-5 TaxID=3332596 RepID=UPI00397F99DE